MSNLKFLSNLVEKSVFVQLYNYLTVNGLHERFQSAFKAHHSRETALLTITNDILLSLDMGDNVFLLLLDYWTCQRHLTRLIILCYFRVWRTRLASRELFRSGFILICLADLSLSKSMIQNRRLGIWLLALRRALSLSHFVCIVHRSTYWDKTKSWTRLSFLCWWYTALHIVQRLCCRFYKAARRELYRW